MTMLDKLNYYWFMRNVDAIINSDDTTEPEFIDIWLDACEWLCPDSEIVKVG